MAFLDKLNDLAKNIGDKTNEAVETAKLNSKIAAEKNAINQEMQQIGFAVYARYQQALPLDEGLTDLLASLDAHYAVIGEAEAQLKAIKEPASAAPEAPAGVCCAQCGAVNVPDAKFCSGCGAKLEPPAEPAERHCPTCGAVVAEDVRFCSKCGAKL